jgi:UDP-glucose 4-epimerase
VQIREVAERIAQCLGIRVRVVPGREAVGGTERRCPDIRKLQALGFSPTVPLSEGLKRTVAWYTAHPKLAESEVAPVGRHG